jgi:hypothetical protein
MRWLWRVAVALWLCAMLASLLVFSTLAAVSWNGSDARLSAVFERRDSTSCPGYREQYDDALLICIHRANESQREWMRTRFKLENILGFAEFVLLPPLMPFLVWSLICLARWFLRSPAYTSD